MYSSRNIAGGLQDVYIELFLDIINFVGDTREPEGHLSDQSKSSRCRQAAASSQLTLKRLSQAFQAAHEDQEQSSPTPASEKPRVAEVFVLSPTSPQ